MTIHCLRIWLFIASLGFLLASIGIYFKSYTFLARIYNGNGRVSPLASRLIAVICLLLSLLAGHCAYEVHNKRFYSLCLWGFLTLLVHLVSEMTFFSTIKPSIYPIAAIVCLGLTVGWMVFAYPRYISKRKHVLESMRASPSKPHVAKPERHRA